MRTHIKAFLLTGILLFPCTSYAGSTGTVQVKPGYKVLITSSKESAGDERFVIKRQIQGYPNVVTLDDLQAGASKEYEAWDRPVTYYFEFKCYWAYRSGDGWKPAREVRSRTADNGDTTIFETENYWSTDNDFNDSIVYVKTTPSANVLDASNKANVEKK